MMIARNTVRWDYLTVISAALDRGQGLRVWFALPDGSIKSVQPSRVCLNMKPLGDDGAQIRRI